MALPLMPKATAQWLVDNTALTFRQISRFCGLHELEVKAIADGEVAQGIVGLNPIANGQISQEELDRCVQNPTADLKLLPPSVAVTRRSKGPRYTPISKRQDKPDAIAWLVKSFPELSDAQVAKLLGTTKQTIAAIRDRTHWNSQNIKPRDPVSLGLCDPRDLDEAVGRARRRLEAEKAEKARKEGRAVEPAAAAAPEPAADTLPSLADLAAQPLAGAELDPDTGAAAEPDPVRA